MPLALGWGGPGMYVPEGELVAAGFRVFLPSSSTIEDLHIPDNMSYTLNS